MNMEPMLFDGREIKGNSKFRKHMVFKDCLSCQNKRFTEMGTQVKCRLKKHFYFDQPCKLYIVDR